MKGCTVITMITRTIIKNNSMFGMEMGIETNERNKTGQESVKSENKGVLRRKRTSYYKRENA